MKYFWWLRALKCVVIVAVVIAGVSWVVMSLWNGLLPGLFGLPSISFIQALGLLVLSRILFGGLRGPGGFGRSMRWRQRMHERWEKMTPEEREKLRSGLRGRCGPWGRGE
ncbi:MAG: hypothetical protein QM808_11795 [Steroidobacteraceae bacterium]